MDDGIMHYYISYPIIYTRLVTLEQSTTLVLLNHFNKDHFTKSYLMNTCSTSAER